MNILIVCGGTGGHLFPGMALGEELLERNHQVLLVVSQKEIDQKALKGSTGFLIQTLPMVGWGGMRPDRLIRFLWKMAGALKKTRQIFRNFQPDVVMSMGGFSAVAPLLLAKRRKIPVCIHDSNAIPGKANRMGARFASVIALSFDEARRFFKGRRTELTGTPIRTALRAKSNLKASSAFEDLLSKAGFDLGQPVVLAMGGSQGARGLNRLVVEAARNLPEHFQWIHLSGEADEKNVRENYASIRRKAIVFPFYQAMNELYSVADVAVSRSGAASLAELLEWAIPSILVPYPFAADRHQTANARVLVDAGAAVMKEEKEWDGPALAGEIQSLVENMERQKEITLGMTKLRFENPHAKLADLVESLAVKV
jgi:UDP-N-acetylglucosamine--N-acetylmuramyl-(pentapeptide) pyrophosphoryl-undecaprenol N-acetylglucosamine transferase